MHFLAKSHLVFYSVVFAGEWFWFQCFMRPELDLPFLSFIYLLIKQDKGVVIVRIYFWNRVIDEVLMESWKH